MTDEQLDRIAKRARLALIGNRKMLLIWMFDHGIKPIWAAAIRERMEVSQCQTCYRWWNEGDVSDGTCVRCVNGR